MSDDARNFLELHGAKHGGLIDHGKPTMALEVTLLKSVVVRNNLFRVGDHVIVLTDVEDDPNYCWN